MTIRHILQRSVIALLLAAAVWWGWRPQGLEGREEAVDAARSALRQLGYEAWGEASVTLEVDQEMAWAVERSRPGEAGIRLARQRSGAVRWRVRFAGGGEVVCSPSGLVFTARRPVPTFVGEDLLPVVARERFQESLRSLVGDRDAWQWRRFQSWFEEGVTWHRAWFSGRAGVLPETWERELELEMAGSTLVSLHRRVQPRGVDLGVVSGRVAELAVLQRPAMVGLVVLVLGVVVAAASAIAHYQPLKVGRGVLVGVLTAVAGVLGGLATGEVAGLALTVAVVVAVLPTFPDLPAGRIEWGAPVGVALALGVMAARTAVVKAGGWIPLTGALPTDPEPWRLLGQAWLPALVEEPLLRALLPGLVAPYLGWWGAAALGAGLGAVLHPLPSVPLSLGLGLEVAVQFGLASAARLGGLPAALMARGTYESLIRRNAFPAGPAWNHAALVGVVLGIGWLLWPRRK